MKRILACLCLFIAMLLLSSPPAFAGTKMVCDTGTDCEFAENVTVQKDVNVGGNVKIFALKGSSISLKRASVLLSGMTGATAVATNLIPAGSIPLGCTLRVTTAITASAGTGFTFGDGTTADRWGAAVALAKGTTTTAANFKAATAPVQAYATATSPTLTMTGGTFTAGAARVNCYYWDMQPSSN